ncbi:hypothetical protein CCMSSC00406_0009319 [Pleurotus cornucopiae]|uniref:Uncharacterized protein n=1 Tax=Pleurotus cornucopiae TaxID=5321 RepID=A0ACB7J5G0_PLECO|nr:hypothetical protein CCMSSC00406_0009319 [Pleurotus cornucopiae]
MVVSGYRHLSHAAISYSSLRITFWFKPPRPRPQTVLWEVAGRKYDVGDTETEGTSQPPKTPRQRLFLDNAADKASPPSALVIAAEVLKVFRPDPNYAALKLECTPR